MRRISRYRRGTEGVLLRKESRNGVVAMFSFTESEGRSPSFRRPRSLLANWGHPLFQWTAHELLVRLALGPTALSTPGPKDPTSHGV